MAKTQKIYAMFIVDMPSLTVQPRFTGTRQECLFESSVSRDYQGNRGKTVVVALEDDTQGALHNAQPAALLAARLKYKTFEKAFQPIKLRNILRDLKACLSDWEKFSNSFNWTPPRTASGRRYDEKKYSHGIFLEWRGKDYQVIHNVTVSCSCYRVEKYVKVNSEKKDLRALRKLIQEVEHFLTHGKYLP